MISHVGYGYRSALFVRILFHVFEKYIAHRSKLDDNVDNEIARFIILTKNEKIARKLRRRPKDMVLKYRYSPASFDRIVFDFVEKGIALHSNLDDSVDDVIVRFIIPEKDEKCGFNLGNRLDDLGGKVREPVGNICPNCIWLCESVHYIQTRAQQKALTKLFRMYDTGTSQLYYAGVYLTSSKSILPSIVTWMSMSMMRSCDLLFCKRMKRLRANKDAVKKTWF